MHHVSAQSSTTKCWTFSLPTRLLLTQTLNGVRRASTKNWRKQLQRRGKDGRRLVRVGVHFHKKKKKGSFCYIYVHVHVYMYRSGRMLIVWIWRWDYRGKGHEIGTCICFIMVVQNSLSTFPIILKERISTLSLLTPVKSTILEGEPFSQIYKGY